MKNELDIYVGAFQTKNLVWGIYARLAKKIADSAQLILSLILVLTHHSFEKDAQCFVLPYNFSLKCLRSLTVWLYDFF